MSSDRCMFCGALIGTAVTIAAHDCASRAAALLRDLVRVSEGTGTIPDDFYRLAREASTLLNGFVHE